MKSNLALFYDSKARIKELIGRLQRRDGDEAYTLRSQIASKLRPLTTVITVAAAGQVPMLDRTIRHLRDSPNLFGHDDEASKVRSDLLRELEEQRIGTRTSRRWFAVVFKDRRARMVFPKDDDPLAVEEQIIDDGSTLFRAGQDAEMIKRLAVYGTRA
jgi:hypothetical protein